MTVTSTDDFNTNTGTHNRINTDGTHNYLFDDQGNRVRKTHIANDTVQIYTWDVKNRLVKVTNYASTSDADADTSATQIVEYSYDMHNRRIGKTVDTDGDGTVDSRERYVYDGDQIAYRFVDEDAVGTTGHAEAEGDELANRYLWGAAVDQLFAQEDVTDIANEGDVLWALTDNLNTVRDVVEYDDVADETNVVNHRTYEAFGKVTSETNPSDPQSAPAKIAFGYTGKIFEEFTKLQQNHHRWYDATTGKWMSQDPIEDDKTNNDRYVGNNPVNATDPTGLTVSGPHDDGGGGKYYKVWSSRIFTFTGWMGLWLGGQERLGTVAYNPGEVSDEEAKTLAWELHDADEPFGYRFYRGNRAAEQMGGTKTTGTMDKIRSEGYSTIGPIPVRTVYFEGMWGQHAFVGFEDPTGVVYRLKDPAKPVQPIGSSGLVENWYKGLDEYAYSVTRADVHRTTWGTQPNTTEAWRTWFETLSPKRESVKWSNATRQAVLKGTFNSGQNFHHEFGEAQDKAIQVLVVDGPLLLVDRFAMLAAASKLNSTPPLGGTARTSAPKNAVIGRKLDYLFGKATGRAHNIERSTDMLRQMERIGLPDTAANRQLMTKHFQDVLNDSKNIIGKGRNGTDIRESLLMGPNGGLKMTSYWDGDTLRTFILEGVGNRFTK